jgi:hypothetical protein
MEKLLTLMLLKTIELPLLPPVTAVTTTVEPLRAAVTTVGRSAVIAVTMLVASAVVLVPIVTWPPVPLLVVTKVKTCVPIWNC